MRRWMGLLLATTLVAGCAETEESGPDATDRVAARDARPDDPPPGTLADGGPGPTPADASTPPVDPEACAVSVDPGDARLLTRLEWDNTVRDLFGDDRRLASRTLPPENRVLGFDNNALMHQATPVWVEGLMVLAEEVAAAAPAAQLAALSDCAGQAAAPEDPCAAAIAGLGRPVFRRPLLSEEVEIFRELFIAAAAEQDAAHAARLTLQAMLQSPQFLYRYDLTRAEEQPEAAIRLSPYALAARLSYFLWASTPDAPLLAAAESGALDTPAGLEEVVRGMFADARVRGSVRHFHRQWLNLHALETLVKDRDYPGGDAALRAALQESLNRFVDHAFQSGVGTLLGSRDLHLDVALADLIDAPRPTTPFERTSMPASERAGILTHPAVLSVLAHHDQTSPIHRGIFVRERLLCQTLPDPPADILIEPPSPDPNATTRERFAQHTEDESCQGCHVLIDPVGFGLESYDEVGRFRVTENGLQVDVSGEVVGAPDPALNGPFEGGVELARRLAQSAAVKRCVSTYWFRYAFARGERREDACTRAAVERAFIEAGGSFEALVIALATSEAFQHRPGRGLAPPVDPPEPVEPPEEPVEPDPNTPREPLGHLDGINNAGAAHGWAFDPASPGEVAAVDLMLDGPPGVGLFLGTYRADLPRPDVNRAHPGIHGDHGFIILLPDAARDGLTHRLFAYVQDFRTGVGQALGNSPLEFRAGLNVNPPREPDPPPDTVLPEGFVDHFSPQGVLAGWALDRDAPDRALTIEVYMDGPALLGGERVGQGTTGLPRPDVNSALQVAGDHGFRIQLDPVVLDGRPHELWVYAFNAGHPGNRLLSRSPLPVGGER